MAAMRFAQAAQREDFEVERMAAERMAPASLSWAPRQRRKTIERRASVMERESLEPAKGTETLSFESLLQGFSTAEMDDAAVAEAQAMARAQEEAKMEAYASVLHVEVPSLLLYLLLTGLLSAVLILSRSGSFDFYFAEMVREAVLNSEMDPADTEVATVFDEITSLEDVYRFLRGPFLAALYVETSYTGTPLEPKDLRRVNDQNVLVGAVRLQQVRVTPNEACEVPELFASPNTSVHIDACFPEWRHAAAHDARPIVGTSKAETAPGLCGTGGTLVGSEACDPNTYGWKAGIESGLGSFSGRQDSYDGSGYAVVLPSASAPTAALLRTLEADGFLGPATRAVWIDFALYNVNINRFCLCRLLFERLASGALTPSAQIRAVNLLWYDGGDIPLLLVAEGCFFLLIFFFICLELRSMRRRGIRDYWLDASNWYDWPALTGYLVVAWMRWKAWAAMGRVKEDIAADAADGSIDVIVNFQAVGWWTEMERTTLAVLALSTYLKVLHYLAGVPHISNLLHTLVRARTQLFAFVLILAVLLLAFASAFHLALGNDLYDWRGVAESSIALLRFVLGDVNVHALMRANPSLGALFYLLFDFLVVLVAVNIFLAIVTNAYTEERATAHYVDLPQVLREGYRRQRARNKAYRAQLYRQMWAPVRRWRKWQRRRRRRKAAEAAGEEDAYDDSDSEDGAGGAGVAAAEPGGSPSFKGGRSVSGRSAVLEAEVAEMTAEEKSAVAAKQMEMAKEHLEGGHLFVLNEVATQLKSLCFRSDERDIPLRGSIAEVLGELERLSSQNDALKARALEAGWVWDLRSGELLPSGRGVGADPIHGNGPSAAQAVDSEIHSGMHAKPKPPARQGAEQLVREGRALEALGLARSLARSSGAAPGGIGAAESPSEGPVAAAVHNAQDYASSFAAFQRAMAADDDAACDAGTVTTHQEQRHRHKHKHGASRRSSARDRDV